MTRETLESVLDTYRLPSGDIWTLPILLQISSVDAQKLAFGDRASLTDNQGKRVSRIFHVKPTPFHYLQAIGIV